MYVTYFLSLLSPICKELSIQALSIVNFCAHAKVHFAISNITEQCWSCLSRSVKRPCIFVMTQGFICLDRFVFVGNCHFLLVSCSATVVKEREDESRSRGFGFVTFYESKHVEDAVYQLNDTVSTLFQEVLYDGPIICVRESILSEMA